MEYQSWTQLPARLASLQGRSWVGNNWRWETGSQGFSMFSFSLLSKWEIFHYETLQHTHTHTQYLRCKCNSWRSFTSQKFSETPGTGCSMKKFPQPVNLQKTFCSSPTAVHTEVHTCICLHVRCTHVTGRLHRQTEQDASQPADLVPTRTWAPRGEGSPLTWRRHLPAV